MKYQEAERSLSILFKNNSISAFFLLVAEIWLGYLFWSVNMYFLYQTYFYSLADTGSNGASFVYFIVFLVPFLLCIPKVSRFVGNNLSFFRLPAVISLLFSLLPIHDLRTVFACVGVAGLLLAFSASCSQHHVGDDGWCGREVQDNVVGRCRHVRFMWGLVGGLLLCWMLRTGFLTTDPQFNYSISYTVVFFFIGLAAVGIVWTSERADKKNALLQEAMEIGKKHAPAKKLSVLHRIFREIAWIPTSAFLGSTLFIIFWMYSSCEALPRWVGVTSETTLSWGWGLILFYVAGLLLTPILFSGILWYALLIIGCGLAGAVLNGGGYLGGLFMAFALPSMIFYIFTEISKIARYGIALGVGFVLFLIYMVTSLGVLLGSVSPMGLPFHHTPSRLLWLVVMLMALLLIVMHTINNIRQDNKSCSSPAQILKGFVGSFTVKKPPTDLLITTGLILLLGILFAIGRAVLYNPDLQTLPHSQRPYEPLKVMTFNVYQGSNTNGTQNVQQAVDVIREYGAHLVGLQESDAVHIATRNIDPVTYIAGHLSMDSYFGLPNVESTVGASIVSRTKLFEHVSIPMAATAEKSLTRPYVQSDFFFNDTLVTIIVVHIELDRWAPKDPQLQITMIADNIKSIDNAVLLLGDFNVQPDSPYIQQLRDVGLTSAYEMRYNLTQPPYNNTLYGATFPRDGRYIDFIFYRNLTLVDAGIFVSRDPDLFGTSDHLPVFAEFRV